MSQPALITDENSHATLDVLPDGWRWVQLKEVCEHIDYGFTASADFKIKEPRFLRITDIQKGRVDWEQVPGCKINATEEATNKLADGDIVFARTGGTTGKSFLIRNPPRAVFASYLIRLQPSAEIDSDFLYSFFQSDDYWKQIKLSARGGAQPNVNATLLGNLYFPLPPFSEQKRIGVILNEQMKAVERARAAAEAQLEAAKALPAAYLRSAFNSREAQKWHKRRLDEVCSISTGTTPDTTRANYFLGDTPFVKTSELLDNRISKAEMHVSQQAINDYRLKIYQPGTVLVAMYGQGKTRGRVGLLEIHATTTQNAAALSPDDSLNSEFLWLWLRSQYKYLRGIGYQGDLSHLSLSFVKQLEIPVLNLSTQKAIAANLREKLHESDQLIPKLEGQLNALMNLPGALLRQAFTGKL